jgi:predicted Zn-dependent protease
VNGLTAYYATFAATTESGSLRGQGSFIELDGRTFRVLTYTLADKFTGYAAAMAGVHTSFARLTDAAALNVQPARLRVERVPRDMTLAQFNTQFPSVVPIETLAVINGAAAGETLRAGQLVKRVVR